MSNDDNQTHYDVLGLPHDATLPQINKQYRTLRAELRETGVPLDDPRYKALHHAHHVLREHELKKQDLYYARERISEQKSPNNVFENVKNHQTYYDVLGLSHNATLPEISRQYRAFRTKFRQMDVPLGSPLYKALNLAHRTLYDQELREQYDQELKKQGLYHETERISGQTPLNDLFENIEDRRYYEYHISKSTNTL